MFAEGHRTASNFMKEVFDSSPTRPQRVKDAWEASQAGRSSVQTYSPEEALNILVETGLTKAQYQLLREGAEAHNAHLYPPYNSVRSAKEACYPPGITCTETSAEVPLQALLDTTVRRLLSTLIDGFAGLGQRIEALFICKWGSDGSSGYTMFKQIAIDPTLNDTNLYAYHVHF